MKQYKITIPDDSLIEQLFDLQLKSSYAEATTYIWFMNPKNRLYSLKDHCGKPMVIFDDNLKIDILLNRPVIYDSKMSEDEIVFRSYLP